MAARKKPRGERAVDRTRAMNAYLAHLKHPLKAEIAAVRTIVMQASDKISERVKWDAPSFYFKADLATFDLHSTKFVHLILLFPEELSIPDDDRLIEVDHENRREVTFRNLTEIAAKKPALQRLVHDFVAAMGGSAEIRT
ncbi:MAG: DUF1801 domain-containing protein [Gemmatimonadota bacterium]